MSSVPLGKDGEVIAGRFELKAPARDVGLTEPWTATDRVSGRGALVKLVSARTANREPWGAVGARVQLLGNPRLPKFIAAGADTDRLWIAYEPVQGRSLADWIDGHLEAKTAPGLGVVTRIFDAVASAAQVGLGRGRDDAMPPAARSGDRHSCAHNGGPIKHPGCSSVIVCGKPAARAGDAAFCNAPGDMITMGEPTVLIGGQMAARMGDPTASGGVITGGADCVLIGSCPGEEAIERANRGDLVVAGLPANEHSTPRNHGHVAVVTTGELYRGTYPRVWSGSLGGNAGRSMGDRSVGQIWRVDDRDRVQYFTPPARETQP